ncbi:sodium-dependent phosphate transport protein 4 isoform X2 [Eurytemora carolleeae]|uniref:sodium-dependent phosphate transport protein 4 isoform X2 n=1 Tax=Eurytemora carolleeae TaxID=1294199 RepID=UPI000C772290|nr:sodium-dependent phosphate transport protein 4 isoform X2 [Eurytemora carolleeae]|eukprot:XP_023343012.1 sodium-dependent phosphate transport protein 4-like isoform X2 [Eurytemora affinis]
MFSMDLFLGALLNLIIAVGSVLGTLVTLIVYDYINMRFVFALCIVYPGFLNIITPPIAKEGGYISVLILRFFTGFYSAIISPAIPMIIQLWFLSTEQCRLNVVVWLGCEMGRMFFFLSGDLINDPNLGWEFLFYMPGAACIVFGTAFFVTITDDPLESPFLSEPEKELIAEDKRREFKPKIKPSCQVHVRRGSRIISKLSSFKKNMKLMKSRKEKLKTPWYKIITDRDVLLSILQSIALSWQSPVMTMMMKKYLQEIHGYSINEAAFMVTIPNNISQVVFGWTSAWLGDLAIQKNIPTLLVRRVGAIICAISSLPYLILPFLPCSIVNKRWFVALIQIFGSFRVAGNLAGYTSFRELSPTYNRQLFGLASLFSSTIPSIMVPLFMGWFKTSTRDQWIGNFATNTTIVCIGNLVYALFIRTNQADWDPYTIEVESEDESESLSQFELVPAGERPYGARVFDAPPIYPPETPAGNNTDVTATGQPTSDKRPDLNTEQLTDVTATGQPTSDKRPDLNTEQLTASTPMGHLTPNKREDLNTEQLTDSTTIGLLTPDKRTELNTEHLTTTRMEHIKHTGPAIPENKTADYPEARS